MTEYKKDYFKDRKLKYEKNHGVFIHEFMFTEFSNRILGQCNVALNDLQRQLDVEIARAKAEEARIEAKAHNELGKIYNYINPSSSAFEDALNSQEPLKYTELAHGNGDILAANSKKDLNSAYNHSMATLTEVFNGFNDSYNALAQAHNAINNLYMVNNADSYTLNDQMRLIKNDQQTKLIANYNDNLMYIAQAINAHTQAIKDLRTALNKLQIKIDPPRVD